MTTIPEAYLSTVFLLGSSRPLRLPSSYAIITAWNPMDRETSREENQREDEALRQSLELQALPFFRVTGCSPDLSHREPGWAVEMPKLDAIAVGRRFGQRAIWWIHGDELTLISCIDGSEHEIGSFQVRAQSE